jgi:hypothetical protein
MGKLDDIFERQKEYMKTLVPTYIHNGFSIHTQWPWDINDRHAQEELRLLGWRYVEEIIEALTIWEMGVLGGAQRKDYEEEVADALHFFVELCLVTGLGPRDITRDGTLDGFFDYVGDTARSHETSGHPFLDCIRSMADAVHTLRQRPWRIDNRPTLKETWALRMYGAFRCFTELCYHTKIRSDDLYNAYFKKSKINEQRVENFGV